MFIRLFISWDTVYAWVSHLTLPAGFTGACGLQLQDWLFARMRKGRKVFKGSPMPTLFKDMWQVLLEVFWTGNRYSWLVASTSPHMCFQRPSMRMARVWQMPASRVNCPNQFWFWWWHRSECKGVGTWPALFLTHTQDPGTMWPSDWTHAVCVQDW